MPKKNVDNYRFNKFPGLQVKNFQSLITLKSKVTIRNFTKHIFLIYDPIYHKTFNKQPIIVLFASAAGQAFIFSTLECLRIDLTTTLLSHTQ